MITKDSIKKIDEAHVDFDKFKYIIKRLALECRHKAINNPKFYTTLENNGTELLFHAIGFNDQNKSIDVSINSKAHLMVKDKSGWRGVLPDSPDLEMMKKFLVKIMAEMHTKFNRDEKFDNLYISALSYRNEMLIVCTSYITEDECMYGVFSTGHENKLKAIEFGRGW